jgi:hypothetical protein
MMQPLHIVCLDAPSPPNYGGAIDMHFKIRALAEYGQRVHLHYFGYRKNRNAGDLKKFCDAVHVYERKPFSASLPLRTPHIVSSRINQDLVSRLKADDFPVLLEGIHTAGILPQLDTGRVVLRMHNDEASYYQSLAGIETKLLKRWYLKREGRLLHKMQESLPKSLQLACLSDTDIKVFQDEYGLTRCSFIPCFIPWQRIQGWEGKGQYCLYHGNMAVKENEASALWLIKEIFSKVKIPLVIAGNRISKEIIQSAHRLRNVRLIHNPPPGELNTIIRDAHIHVLPSVNRTGVKLKILHALFEGRFCITNRNGTAGGRLGPSLHAADSATDFTNKVQELWEQSFTPGHLHQRQDLLRTYNNLVNAVRLIELW